MNKPLYPEELEAMGVENEVPAKDPKATAAKRKKLFAVLAGVVTVAGGGYFACEHFVGSRYVTTDNAYVGADVAMVTPRIEGAVAHVFVADTDRVAAGQVLLVLDDADRRLALAEAEAALAQAERRVQGWHASDGELAAQVAARNAEAKRALAQTRSAQAEFERTRDDLERRQALAASGAVATEELTRAQAAFRQAQAAVAAARAAQDQASATHRASVAALASHQVLTRGAGVLDNPEVVAARARRDQARVELERTVIRAPVSGVVARRQVQLGQRVQAGAPLMAVVPIDRLYVDANFKETQLSRVRPGQEVELVSDLYGEKVKLTGTVVGLSGGTGSAFALIPAQNATGNWIKVVQRVPVRIRLDPRELRAHPLRVGLSMKARIRL